MDTQDCMYKAASGSGEQLSPILVLSLSSLLLLSESFCLIPRQIFAFKSTQTKMSFQLPLCWQIVIKLFCIKVRMRRRTFSDRTSLLPKFKTSHLS